MIESREVKWSPPSLNLNGDSKSQLVKSSSHHPNHQPIKHPLSLTNDQTSPPPTITQPNYRGVRGTLKHELTPVNERTSPGHPPRATSNRTYDPH